MNKIFMLLLITAIPLSVWAGNNEDLLNGAVNGKLEVVKKALKDGADVNAKDKNGANALIFAAAKGNIEIMKLLVVKKANLNYISSKYGETVISVAVKYNHLIVLNYLKSLNANLEKRHWEQGLLLAAQNGISHYKILKFLILNNVDINAVDNDQNSALMWAARNGNLEIVKFLLSKKANINHKNKLGETALVWAHYGKKADIVDYLIKNGAQKHIKIHRHENKLKSSEKSE